MFKFILYTIFEFEETCKAQNHMRRHLEAFFTIPEKMNHYINLSLIEDLFVWGEKCFSNNNMALAFKKQQYLRRNYPLLLLLAPSTV